MAENNHEHVITMEPLWEKRPVFKLPLHITSVNTNAFKPIVVSFGPYHHGKEHLKPMEAHKQISLKRFLEISGKKLEDIIQSFEPMKQDLIHHYDQLDDNWGHENRFLELMVIDGCFMLDILRSTSEVTSVYNTNNPVFKQSVQSNIMYQNIKRDMLLIENQLPLLVLENLIADTRVVLDELMERNIDEYWKKLMMGDNKVVPEKLKIEKSEDRIKLILEETTVKELIRKLVR